MMKSHSHRERGQVLLPMIVSSIAFLGFAGLAVDVGLLFATKARLVASVDSAALAAAATVGNAQSLAQSTFDANFRSGYLGTRSRLLSVPVAGSNSLTITGEAEAPVYFMQVFGRQSVTVRASAIVRLPAMAGEFLLMDEDAIDDGLSVISTISNNAPRCGNRNAARCVNDDIAGLNQRSFLFTRGTNITPYSPITLPTGQNGDWGLYRFTSPDPQVSMQNNANFTRIQLWNGTGTAANENNLDKVRDVTPLNAADIQALTGKTVCALVWDSDISVDVPQHHASLKGATLGRTAFVVDAVVASPSGGSNLPNIRISLLASSTINSVCPAIVGGSTTGTSGQNVYLLQ